MYIFASGVIIPVSQKSYANVPLVKLGHDAGSIAMILTSLSPLSFSPINGDIRPPRFEPPPAQPIIISGLILYLSSAALVSRPIID